MPVWLQIVLGVYAAIMSAATIYITLRESTKKEKKESNEEIRDIRERIVKLETTVNTLDEYMAEILLKNL